MSIDPAPVTSVVVAGVLAGLLLLHAYWCVVGISGRSIALPEIDGRPTFQPSQLASFGVAVGLGLAAWLVAATKILDELKEIRPSDGVQFSGV